MKFTKFARLSTFAGMLTLPAIFAAIACAEAAPSECLQAAEKAGLPDAIIERIAKPDGLNPVERIALRKALEKAGIADLCSAAIAKAPNLIAAAATKSAEAAVGRPAPRREAENEPGATSVSAGQYRDEYRRTCRFWALTNLDPVVYVEFSKLEPDQMDDLDRILWRKVLHPSEHFGGYTGFSDAQPTIGGHDGSFCRDYWAEPLNKRNANLRNQQFEAGCRIHLNDRIIKTYANLAEQATRYHNDDTNFVYQTPNQYVRVLRWIDIAGDELRKMDNPPYAILQKLSAYPYTWRQYDYYNEDARRNYREEHGHPMNPEWVGMLAIAGLGGDIGTTGRMLDCHYYYPQLFYGYWAPVDSRPYYSEADLRDIPEPPGYDPALHQLYLPKQVLAAEVPEGYPLGMAEDRYEICAGRKSAESAGYYFVDHPEGSYCERIR